MKFVIVVSTLIFLGACSFEKAHDLIPQSKADCDTAGVTFSKDIRPILEMRCFGCHSGFGDPVYEYTDFFAFQAMALNGKLIPAVTQTGPRPMPKGRERIPDCEIAKIKAWVASGAPNN